MSIIKHFSFATEMMFSCNNFPISRLSLASSSSYLSLSAPHNKGDIKSVKGKPIMMLLIIHGVIYWAMVL